MKNSLIFLFVFFYLFPTKATNIVVLNIDEIINNNSQYLLILENIDKNQKPYLESFNNTEIALDELLKDIEESKILLNEEELNIKINIYNEKLKDFRKIIEDFNTHYENQIVNIRKIILKEIIFLIEKYAKNNNIDLVLDSTSYLIASNAINITEYIDNELKKIILELEFTNFEKN